MKYQTKDGRSLALIPALHIDGGGGRTASLQVITDQGTWWVDYPEGDFHASERQFQICMGENVFCQQGARLHVECDGLSLHGALSHGRFCPLCSDIMGPFRAVPGMECSHGVISMGHSLSGTVTLNQETMDFFGGMGYVETDRGRSFPETYLWTQCAWRDPQRVSLMLSVATIPLGRIQFTGCICVVLYNGREHRLATYRGARVAHWSPRGAVLRQGKYWLEVEVLEGQGHPLRAPVEGAMKRTIHESLCASVCYRFWMEKTLLFEHTDCHAGFEYAAQTQGPASGWSQD